MPELEKSINIFWFRRDLRLTDNTALSYAAKQKTPLLLLFIFDNNIIDELSTDDPRINFIYQQLQLLNQELAETDNFIKVKKGKPLEVFSQLLKDFNIKTVYANRDYEPYALLRDNQVKAQLEENRANLVTFKDQMIFEPNEILKQDGKPYTVFTPFKKKWLQKFQTSDIAFHSKPNLNNLFIPQQQYPSKTDLGISPSRIKVRPFDLEVLDNYVALRDIPAADQTSYLSPYLRFGTISIRKIIEQLRPSDSVFLSELIWREFFMQILFHFPDVVSSSFRSKYDRILWRNNIDEFELWKNGRTGYPLVDAGMRQLNSTGYMHNRVRMIVASFLCKHLLIDWRWGEAYFAEKLLDYELSSNNGNWQWAAGTGCDAAPYFRIFNPYTQQQKFDPSFSYVRKWVPEFETSSYPLPIIDHKIARNRALTTYKKALSFE